MAAVSLSMLTVRDRPPLAVAFDTLIAYDGS
jgi:hypothetical protein